ncbi:hypothetical protein H4582DRAFT_2054564 [Lactarius indigo]|nr:hypothetical protein H4582DRAFT_2054564 [Lactarius indigo]
MSAMSNTNLARRPTGPYPVLAGNQSVLQPGFRPIRCRRKVLAAQPDIEEVEEGWSQASSRSAVKQYHPQSVPRALPGNGLPVVDDREVEYPRRDVATREIRSGQATEANALVEIIILALEVLEDVCAGISGAERISRVALCSTTERRAGHGPGSAAPSRDLPRHAPFPAPRRTRDLVAAYMETQSPSSDGSRCGERVSERAGSGIVRVGIPVELERCTKKIIWSA